MSRCAKCDGRGYIEGYVAAQASYTPSLEQCPLRCNITGYSNEVQRRLSPGHVTARPVMPHVHVEKSAKVIPLRRPTLEGNS